MLVMERDGSLRENGGNDLPSRRVKGTIDISEQVVRHNRDVLGRLLEIVFLRWGRRAIELHICSDEPEARGVPAGRDQLPITLAGPTFPVSLDYR